MSLLDGLLLGSLLGRSVMQQAYYVALRSDGAPGSGTMNDPYNGSKLTGSMVVNFDAAMRSIPPNATIYLGPCKFNSDRTVNEAFVTNGFTGVPTTGFAAQSGQRIIGAGLDVTFIQLTGQSAATECNCVIANDEADPTKYLNGFEVSDFTIDANFAGPMQDATAATGGISVTGKNLFIRRVRVFNFGSGQSNVMVLGISAARADTSVASPSNAVIDSCRVDGPSTDSHNTGPSVALHLGVTNTAGANRHKQCVIRNCYVDGCGTTKEIYGIMADGGEGTTVERNRVLNCKYGGPYYDDSITTQPARNTDDLIVRENYYYNVTKGLYFKRTVASLTGFFGRCIVLNNQFEMPTGMGNQAIYFEANPTNTTATTCYDTLIIRGNRIRLISGTDNVAGISAQSVGKLMIDNNYVDVGVGTSVAVRRGAVGTVQVFNNRTLYNEFIPVSIIGDTAHQGELTTDAEVGVMNLLGQPS